MRPAQRAVACVHVEIADLALANDRYVAWRGGAQACPVAGLRRVARAWEELLHTAHDGLAAHAVQIAVVAI